MMRIPSSGRPSAADPAEGCIRDMMGMVALPALWAGRDGAGILKIMSEAIARVVPFDFCFMQVVLQADEPEFVLAQVRPGLPQPAGLGAWQDAAQQWSAVKIPDGRAFDAATPLRPARLVALSMGFGTHGGKIWFGSSDPAFPTYHQLALLRVASSLAATGLQAARINQEREQASRAKDEFLAMLAHELRNPLAPISAAADLLAIMEPDRERVRKASAVISRQARHMTGLIDDLLDVSRVTRGTIELDRDAVDLAKVVADAVEQARPLLDARCHRLALHLPGTSVTVNGDHKRLVQAVSNVLNNAAKYTPNGGNIVLHLDVEETGAAVTVIDDGVGMSADLVKRAFDLFAQAQRTSDRSQGGLGLGLALVKSLVGLHGGTVSAHSAGAGRGSTFTIRLPRLVQAQVPGRPAPSAGAPGGPGLRVMIVDDNVDAAQMLAAFLKTVGHEVSVAHDAASALASAARLAPQVFLLDIGLPVMDGYELARRLRGSAATGAAMLVAITGYGGAQDRARTAAAGFDHHFVKPVDLGELTRLLGATPACAAPARS